MPSGASQAPLLTVHTYKHASSKPTPIQLLQSVSPNLQEHLHRSPGGQPLWYKKS
jgi:hypothetical protein